MFESFLRSATVVVAVSLVVVLAIMAVRAVWSRVRARLETPAGPVGPGPPVPTRPPTRPAERPPEVRRAPEPQRPPEVRRAPEPQRAREVERAPEVEALARQRGRDGEEEVRRVLRRLPGRTYRRFHELFPNKAGSTALTEVDFVVLSHYGVFVIEVKWEVGTVFVLPDEDEWPVEKHRGPATMRNPLRQNGLHLRAIGDLLGVDPPWLRSVVCFAGGRTTLMNAVSNVVLTDELLDHVRSFDRMVFDDAEIDRMARLLTALDAQTAQRRVRHRRQMEEQRRRFEGR